MASKELNIGQLIKDKIDEQHWSYAEFARAICCSRSSLYNIFQNHDITIGRLNAISRVLGYDFFKALGDETQSTGACLMIPFSNGTPDLSDLPETLISMLKEALEGYCTKQIQ